MVTLTKFDWKIVTVTFKKINITLEKHHLSLKQLLTFCQNRFLKSESKKYSIWKPHNTILFPLSNKMLAACYRTQSLEYNTCKIDVEFLHLILTKWQSIAFSTMGRRGMQKLSRHADHICRSCGGLEASTPILYVQTTDATCSTGRSRDDNLNSKGHIPVLSTSKMALTSSDNLNNLFYHFWKWGRKFVIKKFQ